MNSVPDMIRGVWPFILMMFAVLPAVEQALAALHRGEPPTRLCTFEHLQDVVGFPQYYQEEKRYQV